MIVLFSYPIGLLLLCFLKSAHHNFILSVHLDPTWWCCWPRQLQILRARYSTKYTNVLYSVQYKFDLSSVLVKNCWYCTCFAYKKFKRIVLQLTFEAIECTWIVILHIYRSMYVRSCDFRDSWPQRQALHRFLEYRRMGKEELCRSSGTYLEHKSQ